MGSRTSPASHQRFFLYQGRVAFAYACAALASALADLCGLVFPVSVLMLTTVKTMDESCQENADIEISTTPSGPRAREGAAAPLIGARLGSTTTGSRRLCG